MKQEYDLLVNGRRNAPAFRVSKPEYSPMEIEKRWRDAHAHEMDWEEPTGWVWTDDFAARQYDDPQWRKLFEAGETTQTVPLDKRPFDHAITCLQDWQKMYDQGYRGTYNPAEAKLAHARREAKKQTAKHRQTHEAQKARTPADPPTGRKSPAQAGGNPINEPLARGPKTKTGLLDDLSDIEDEAEDSRSRTQTVPDKGRTGLLDDLSSLSSGEDDSGEDDSGEEDNVSLAPSQESSPRATEKPVNPIEAALDELNNEGKAAQRAAGTLPYTTVRDHARRGPAFLETMGYRDIRGHYYFVSADDRLQHRREEPNEDAIYGLDGRANVAPASYLWDARTNTYLAVYADWPERSVLHPDEEAVAQQWVKANYCVEFLPEPRGDGGIHRHAVPHQHLWVMIQEARRVNSTPFDEPLDEYANAIYQSRKATYLKRIGLDQNFEAVMEEA